MLAYAGYYVLQHHVRKGGAVVAGVGYCVAECSNTYGNDRAAVADAGIFRCS